MNDQGSRAEALWQQWRHLADTSIDVVLEADMRTAITWASPSITAVLGWRPDDVIGMTPADLVHPQDLHLIVAEIERMLGGSSAGDDPKSTAASTVRLLTSSGGHRPLTYRARVLAGDRGGAGGFLITLRDTSDRDEALRALSVLTEANRVIAAAVDDERSLLHAMCDVIVSTGEYPLAWYGRPVEDEARSVAACAVAGPASAYATDLDISWGDGPTGRGPTGTCLRTGTTTVAADLGDNPDFLPWLPAAKAFGLRSSIAMPILAEGRIDGALMVYAETPGAFDARARELLETLATDLGLGLERLRAGRRLREQSRRLSESEGRYRLLAEHASDVVVRSPANGGIDWVSDSVRNVLGWAPEDLIGKRWDMVHPEDMELAQTAQAALDRNGHSDAELRIVCADGANKWVRMLVHRVATEDGDFDIAALQDIDREVRARRELDFSLGHDPLTGMAARPAMAERIVAALRSLGEGDQAALLCLSVDRLSAVNDAFTHAVGDVVLTTFATRLLEITGRPEYVGRGNGVEFLVLVPQLTGGDELAKLAQGLLTLAREPFFTDDARIDVTASIGIAVGGRDDDADQLMRDASAAMRSAKAEGRDRFAFSDPGMVEQARHYLHVEQRIKEAIDTGLFVAHFQPIVDLGDAEVSGYEALVRARREDGRPLAFPGEFMSVAERSGLVCHIDLIMLSAALAALATLPPHLTVSVNLSTLTMTRPGYLQRIRDLVQQSGVRPSRLHLEVTETSLLGESGAITDGMTSLAELGTRWYVDDFGTGYSSISHLRDLPISGLKLDVSFAAGVRQGHARSVRLANALAGLARGLGLDTVAEGIETEAEAEALFSQGWRHGQGYLYGKGELLPDIRLP